MLNHEVFSKHYISLYLPSGNESVLYHVWKSTTNIWHLPCDYCHSFCFQLRNFESLNPQDTLAKYIVCHFILKWEFQNIKEFDTVSWTSSREMMTVDARISWLQQENWSLTPTVHCLWVPLIWTTDSANCKIVWFI